MKLFPNPITSPSRVDKFPPSLKRSLRKNGGSRSRGRSRLSPLFIRKKNGPATAETQEPSSPKVTCFGQVRVRKSKGRRSRTKRRCCYCYWIRKVLSCNSCDCESKVKAFRSGWKRWVQFCSVGFHGKGEEHKEESREGEAKPEEVAERDERKEEEEEVVVEEEDVMEVVKVLVSASPPKNALLLMRSKSEAYRRPSSLANLFWGSPASTEGAAERTHRTEEERKDENEEKPTLENVLSCRDSTAEPREEVLENEENLGICEEEAASSSSSNCNSKTIKSSKIEDERGRRKLDSSSSSGLPVVVLRRSKSESARTAVKFDSSEIFFLNKKRLVYEEQ